MTVSLKFLLYLLVMSLVTYLLRMLPLVFVKKKLESKFIERFLYYIPYTVLASMTFPAVFYSTGIPISAVIGVVVALILAYFEKGLVVVSLGATCAVFVCEMLNNCIFA